MTEFTRKQILDALDSTGRVAEGLVDSASSKIARAKIKHGKYLRKKSALHYARSIGLNPKRLSKDACRKMIVEKIIRTFTRKGLKKMELARCCQTSRPRISRLMNQKSNEFSIDAMISILDILGVETKITFHE